MPRETAWTIVLGGVIAAALVACVVAAHSDGSLLVPTSGGHPTGDTTSSWVFLACLVAGFLAYVGAIVIVAKRDLAMRIALAMGIAIQLVPLAAPLVLSTDAWTYWDYGRIAVVHDGNPYVQPPAAFPDDPAFAYVGSRWGQTPSVYGPLFTMATRPLAHVAGESADIAAWLFKAIAALAMIAAMIGVSRVAKRPALATIVVGWSPLLAIQAAGAGHNDAWLAALAIAALVAMRAKKPILAGAAWALAGLVKWIPLLLVPLLGVAAIARARREPGERRTIVYACAGFAIAAGTSIALASAYYGTSWMNAFDAMSHNASSPTGYSFAYRLGQLGLPASVARVIPVIVLALVGLYVLRAAIRGRARIGLATCALVACSPLAAPWYLLWAAPLAVTDEDDRAPIILAVVLSAALLVQGIPIH